MEKTSKIKQTRESNQFQKLFQHANEIFWLQNQSQILFINPAFEKTFGISPVELYATPHVFIEKIHPEDKLELYKEYTRMKAGAKINTKFRIIKPDGSIRWLSARTYPSSENFQGQAVTLGIASDITESKEKEIELIEKRDKAEESDRLKTSFLSTISHELRTPLNAILGFSELICMESKEELSLEFGEGIYKSGQNLLHIIENILTFTQLNSNTYKYSPNCFYISEIMKALSLERYSGRITFLSDNIELEYKPDKKENNPLCKGDCKIIMNIFDILLENALLYTPEGKITYGFRLPHKKQIQFFVKDTGIGISEENQPLILDYFRQADSSLTRKYGGIGLGLSIAHKLVNLHNGELSFRSELGKGSEFFFTLPCRISELELENLRIQ